MKIIKPSYEIMTPIDGDDMLRYIERCGRVCYKSEGSINHDSHLRFAKSIIARGHEAVLEHSQIGVRFICDRGVSHEIVRHRMASYAQESTRYCNYTKDKFGSDITFIRPSFFNTIERQAEYKCWKNACQEAEDAYFSLINRGAKPEEARAVLPNSLKTELIMTTNIREWRHFFKLRCAKDAHPQIRELALPLLQDFKLQIPVVFDDIERK